MPLQIVKETSLTDQDYQYIRNRLLRWCSVRDRCSSELVSKLTEFDLDLNQAENLKQEFFEKKYVDDLRFSISYVRGKFYSNKWGRLKIRNGLNVKQIPSELINLALEEIPHEAYLKLLNSLASKHKKSIKKGKLNTYPKTYNYLYSKGFEPDLIVGVLGN